MLNREVQIGSDKDDLYLKYQYYCNYFKERMPVCKEIESRIAQEFPITEREISSVRTLTSLPYSFCHPVLNNLRTEVDRL